MAAILFWLMIVITLGIVVAYFKGYPNLFPAAFISLLISAVLAKSAGDGSRKDVSSARSEFNSRLSTLDSIVSDLTKSFKEQKEQANFTLGAFEAVKDELRTDFKNSIDRVAERMIDFENSVNQMKRTFSAAFASLDDRLRVIEPKQIALTPQIAVDDASYVELDRQAE